MIQTLKHYHDVVGLRGLLSAIRGKSTRVPLLLRMERPDVRHPFYLRVPSSDVSACEQIFIRRDYDFEARRPPRVIVDAGANIGLASILFANRFPAARIIAIEPEASNFRLLQRNVAPYGNITAIQGALWHENRPIRLVDPSLGNWGFMTRAAEEGEGPGSLPGSIPGMTMDALMESQDIDRIDILKMDIEGAEREVFMDSSAWLHRVDSLVVELHERLKPGCNRSFYNGTAGFDEEWWQGENVCLTRAGGCLLPPGGTRGG